jgi:hypothetical protein
MAGIQAWQAAGLDAAERTIASLPARLGEVLTELSSMDAGRTAACEARVVDIVASVQVRRYTTCDAASQQSISVDV